MIATQLKRVFIFDKMELQDPNPTLSTKEVISFYSNQYPKLNNARIDNQVVNESKGAIEYKVVATFGEKG